MKQRAGHADTHIYVRVEKLGKVKGNVTVLLVN